VHMRGKKIGVGESKIAYFYKSPKFKLAQNDMMMV
jgi:hypothetical protein